MNSNEISNPKTEVIEGINLNEKDYLGCLLSSLKEMSKNYTICMTEASNENIYQMYFSTFQEIINLQRQVYELMFKNGWYKLEHADNNKISQKLNMLSQEYSNLNI